MQCVQGFIYGTNKTPTEWNSLWTYHYAISKTIFSFSMNAFEVKGLQPIRIYLHEHCPILLFILMFKNICHKKGEGRV